MSKDTDTSRGVEKAWDFWLSQHDVSVPELIEAAIERSVLRWMDSNTEVILERVARACEPERPL